MTDRPTPTPTPTSGRPRRLRRLLVVGLVVGGLAAILLVILVAAANMWVLHDGGPRYDAVSEVPGRPVAVVFGAGIDGDQPSPALRDRLDAAVALYQAGTVPKLLVTGDNHSTGYDEVTVMRAYLMDHGVPAEDITRDYAGFDTYDSCYRARTIFGVESAVLVTQDYHLARALFTCRQLGIDVVGLAVPDWQHHPEQAGFVVADIDAPGQHRARVAGPGQRSRADRDRPARRRARRAAGRPRPELRVAQLMESSGPPRRRCCRTGSGRRAEVRASPPGPTAKGPPRRGRP